MQVAFLRGINVGGRILKMERLRQLLTDAGLGPVRTYIQSGNVIFDADHDPAELEARMEDLLAKELGSPVPCFVRSKADFLQTLETAPFASMVRPDDQRFLVLYCRAGLSTDSPMPILSDRGDLEILGHTSREIFLRSTVSEGRIPDPERLLRATFGPKTNTARFFHTLQKFARVLS